MKLSYREVFQYAAAAALGFAVANFAFNIFMTILFSRL